MLSYLIPLDSAASGEFHYGTGEHLALYIVGQLRG